MFRERGSLSIVFPLSTTLHLSLVVVVLRLQRLLLGLQDTDLSSADSDDFTPPLRFLDFLVVPNAEVGLATDDY